MLHASANSITFCHGRLYKIAFAFYPFLPRYTINPPPPHGTIFEVVGYKEEPGHGRSYNIHRYCGILMEVGITVWLHLIKLNFCGKPEPALAIHYINNDGQESCRIGFTKAHLARHMQYDVVYGRAIKMHHGQKFHHNRGWANVEVIPPPVPNKCAVVDLTTPTKSPPTKKWNARERMLFNTLSSPILMMVDKIAHESSLSITSFHNYLSHNLQQYY